MAKAVSKLSANGRKKLTVLTMGPKESQYLRDLIGGQIKGKIKNTRRTHNTAILQALKSAGLVYKHNRDLRGYVFISKAA